MAGSGAAANWAAARSASAMATGSSAPPSPSASAEASASRLSVVARQVSSAAAVPATTATVASVPRSGIGLMAMSSAGSHR